MNEKIVKAENKSEAFELAQRQAKAFASSNLVPEQYRNNVPNTLIAMELAERIGASIFAVMQKLYIVHGKPAFEATFLIGTVNSCGRFTPLRYRFEGKQGTDDWGCRAVACDKETGEECVGPLVTIGMSKKEGWYGKKGSKWATMPELMLHYRAAAFWTRVFAPELSMGMHTVEEINESNSIGPALVVGPAAPPDAPPDDRDPLDAVADQLDVYQEVIETAKSMFGDDWEKNILSLCDTHCINWKAVTEKELSTILDILNEESAQ